SFCASLKTILISGCLSASALMSAFICTRQGSPRLHWLIPITYFGAATSGKAARVHRSAANKRNFVIDLMDHLLFKVWFLQTSRKSFSCPSPPSGTGGYF